MNEINNLASNLSDRDPVLAKFFSAEPLKVPNSSFVFMAQSHCNKFKVPVVMFPFTIQLNLPSATTQNIKHVSGCLWRWSITSSERYSDHNGLIFDSLAYVSFRDTNMY